MIPVRRNKDQSPTAQPLDITSRLQRLRFEQRNHPLQLPPRQPADGNQHISLSGYPALGFIAIDPQPQPISIEQPSSARRGTAGPSAPPSWLNSGRETSEASSQRRREALRRALVPLDAGDAWLAPLPNGKDRVIPSLSEVCSRTIALDLAKGRKGSALLEYVTWLPPRLRLPLLEAAPSKCGVGLCLEAIKQILEAEQEHAEQDDGIEGTSESEATPPPPATPHVEEDSVVDKGWETLSISSRISVAAISDTLTSLDLSLSSLDVASLHSLLLSSAPRPTPIFPHLATLRLIGMPRLTIDDALLDVLSLVSLPFRTLSLACLPLGDGISASTLLPRLALVTPTLWSLDLSFVEGLTPAILRNVNWDHRWKALRVVGWRRWMFPLEEKGKEASRGRKDELAIEMWATVRASRKERGQHVRFVT